MLIGPTLIDGNMNSGDCSNYYFSETFSPDSVVFSYACVDHYSAKTLRRISLELELFVYAAFSLSFALQILAALVSPLTLNRLLIQWDHWSLIKFHFSFPSVSFSLITLQTIDLISFISFFWGSLSWDDDVWCLKVTVYIFCLVFWFFKVRG